VTKRVSDPFLGEARAHLDRVNTVEPFIGFFISLLK